MLRRLFAGRGVEEVFMKTGLRALVLALLLVAVFGFAAMAANYVGSETCKSCHSDTYADWQGTWHSKHVVKPDSGLLYGDFRTNKWFKKNDVKYAVGNSRKQYYVAKDNSYLPAYWDGEAGKWVEAKQSSKWDSACAKCHTTGFDAKTARFAELNITCESCHGPGSEHVARGGDKTKIKKDLSNATCSQCHGQGAQLEQMGHTTHFANMLATNDHYNDSCMSCHSATYIFAPKDAKPTVKDFKTGALKNDRIGITCVVCHDPHKKANEAQLRKDPQETCVQCHTSEGPVAAGKDPHHGQKEIFEGNIGFGVAATPSAKTARCVDCHMANGNHFFKVGTPELKLTEHGKEITVNSCSKCHSNMTAEHIKDIQTRVQAQMKTLRGRLDAVKAKLDAAKKSGKDVAAIEQLYKEAYTNVGWIDAGKGEGIHNTDLVFKLLTAADEKLARAEGQL